jgi:hypothetical protein
LWYSYVLKIITREERLCPEKIVRKEDLIRWGGSPKYYNGLGRQLRLVPESADGGEISIDP